MGHSEGNAVGQGRCVVIVPEPCDKNSVCHCAQGESLELPDGFFKLFFQCGPAGGLDFDAFGGGCHQVTFILVLWVSRHGMACVSSRCRAFVENLLECKQGSWLSRQLACRVGSLGQT